MMLCTERDEIERQRACRDHQGHRYFGIALGPSRGELEKKKEVKIASRVFFFARNVQFDVVSQSPPDAPPLSRSRATSGHQIRPYTPQIVNVYIEWRVCVCGEL